MSGLAIKTFLTTVVLVCAFNLFSADIQSVKINKLAVTAEFVNPPEVSYSGSLQFSPLRSRLLNRWTMITVEFTPEILRKIERSKRSTVLTNYERINRSWLDNVEIQVRVLCEAIGEKNTINYALFSGSAKVWTMKIDRNRHTVLFFIPPQLLDRYYFPHRQLGNASARKRMRAVSDTAYKMNKADTLIIEATVSVNNNKLGRAYANTSKKNFAAAEAEFSKKLSVVPANYNLEGAVLSKGQSPWAFYKINQFDTEKVTAR